MLTLNAALMSKMSDSHLIASLRAEASPLMTTAAEMELINRFETLLDERNTFADLIALSDEHSFNGDDLRQVCNAHPGTFSDYAKMLTILNEAEISDADELKIFVDVNIGEHAMTQTKAEESILKAAQALVDHAKQHGVVLTIELKPLQPLAMGNYEPEASVRTLRNWKELK